MAASGSLFTPVRRRYDSSKLSSQFDADGKRVEVETREDEEQGVKMGQTVELLLAAGYFRARIKGLSPFDKVVGGMTWCITTCNFDVNVDLLFQENSTIGQKIALTEKIVAVLPRMMCPHRIEPHQIQGLDFIHIFPVIQWLVKRALETRELMGDYIRSFSISQFNKSHMTPEDKAFEDIKEKSCRTVSDVRAAYKPQRRYCCHDASLLREEEIRVHSTLLEYGRQYEISREAKPEEDETIAKKAAETAGLAGQKVTSGEDQAEEEEERRLKMLMSGMSAMGTQEGKLSASAVGSIVGMQSAEIHQIASEYADKQAELGQMEKSERVGGLQHHKRLVASLNKQIQQQKSKLEEISTKHSEFHKTYLKMQDTLREIQDQGKLLESEIENLGELESLGNQSILESLRMLVAMNENLKKQEQQFKAHCKEEKTRLTDNVEKLKAETDGDSDDKERMSVIEKQYQADKGKLQKIRLLLAKKNREIAILQRKIDEVPSRAELSQYQRRFIELYNQVGAKYKETKQFYTLYNTLDDKKLHLNKEVNLLNSIYDNFSQAMSSSSTKEQFLRQLEQIVDVVTQNRIKVDKKKQEEKIKRDQLSDQYLELVEKQRLYFKNIKEFQEECRKNEILTSKCRS